jgi:hypothetical protein
MACTCSGGGSLGQTRVVRYRSRVFQINNKLRTRIACIRLKREDR